MPGSVHAVEPVLDKANKAKILIYIQSWFDIQASIAAHSNNIYNK